MIGKSFLVGATFAVAALGASQTFVPPSSVRSKTARMAHTNYVVFRGARAWAHPGGVTRAAIPGYYPSDIRAAYSLPSTGGTQAIAIVDAYDLPTNLKDFNTFSAQFGLPQETSSSPTAGTNKVLQVVYATGKKPKADGDFGAEIALDIEWAHAIAPNAKIFLVECASNSLDDLTAGIRKAAQLTTVREVSMSFGASEFSGETSLDSNFSATNQVYFAAAGDTANELDYPAVSPRVVAVGGTSLTVVGGSFFTETAWEDGGGGPSRYEPRPSFQAGFTTGMRGTPDVSAVADPATGVAVYVSTPLSDGSVGWLVFGGTSLACPIVAAITNLRGNFAATSTAELARQYSLAGSNHFRDITTGSAGAYDAVAGYDFITGLGSLTGTFPTKTYAPSTFALTTGLRIGGVPGNVVAKDGHNYLLRGVNGVAVVRGTFSAPLAGGATRSGATLSLTGLSSGSGLMVSVYNVSSGAWEAVSTTNLGAVNGTLTIPLPAYASYFDSSGTASFMISANGTNTLRFGLDQVQLAVSTTF